MPINDERPDKENEMAHYILIDNQVGYIWSDTRDLAGWSQDMTPEDAARITDENVGESDRTYSDESRRYQGPAYHVYRVDVNGSEAVTLVTDGQNREMIEAVERDCEYETTVGIRAPDES